MHMLKSIDGYQIASLAGGYSPLTISAYRSCLMLLTVYLEDPLLENITSADLARFMAWLRTDYKPVRRSGSTEPLSTASYHRYWKAIRSFFTWACKEFNIPRPDLELKMPAYTNREIIPFSEDDIKKLLRSAERATVPQGKRQAYTFQPPNRLRNRALLLLLLDTGLRVGEVTRLHIEDVNLETGEVAVLPHHVRKTRPRTTYLSAASRKALWRYLASRENTRPNDPLFVNAAGQPMTRHSILALCRRLGEQAGVHSTHPHRFRHTFAIQYLRNGGDVFTLQRLLGHATLDMVRKYLALADADSSTAHQKASPVDRWHL